MSHVSRQQALALYRKVLKAHVNHLADPMKRLGDGMFKTEFRQHVALEGGATREQWEEFVTQWNAYCDILASMPRRTRTVCDRDSVGNEEDLEATKNG